MSVADSSFNPYRAVSIIALLAIFPALGVLFDDFLSGIALVGLSVLLASAFYRIDIDIEKLKDENKKIKFELDRISSQLSNQNPSDQ